MKNRFISLLIAAVMIVGMLPVTAVAASHPFTDVSSADWYYDAVEFVYGEGLMPGTSDTAFSPTSDATRSTLVMLLHRLDGEPEVISSTELSDVAADAEYAPAMAWAVAYEILTGYGDGIFAPENPLTREQLATILWRYAKYKEYDVSSGEDMVLSAYADADQISTYATDAMKWAVAEEIIGGRPGYILDPADNAQRAEMAAIVHRFSSRYIPDAPVEEEDKEDTYFTVDFKYNYDGRDTYLSVQVKAGECVTTPAPLYRAGYLFNGWYTAASGGTAFDFGTPITANLTLYAAWATPPLFMHTHTFASAWTFNSTHHWHVATCGHSATTDVSEHVYGKRICTEPAACLICGYISPAGASHTFGAYTTADGTHTRTCLICDTVDTGACTYTGAFKHDASGHYKECDVCHKAGTVSAHTWDSGVVTTDPTCTEVGVKTFTCTDCGETKTADVDATGHNFTGAYVNKGSDGHTRKCVNANCTAESEISAHEWNDLNCANATDCKHCGFEKGAGEHTWGDWAIDSEDANKHTRTCTSTGCGATESEAHSVTAPQKDDTHHWNKCTKCTATDTKIAHAYTWAKDDETNHEGTCSCGHKVTEAHDFTVAQKNDTHHWNKCAKCDDTDTEVAHTYTGWTAVEATTHKGTCSCGAEKTDSCTFNLVLSADEAMGTFTCEKTCGNSYVESYVAKITSGETTTYYKTITEAQADATGKTIVILAETTMTVASGANITVDANGKAVTVSYSTVADVKIKHANSANVTATIGGKTAQFSQTADQNGNLIVDVAYTKIDTRYTSVDIYTADGMMWFNSNSMNNHSEYRVTVTLKNDIDMAGKNWIATYERYWLDFDGENHVISNLTSNPDTTHAENRGRGGLFGGLFGSTVKNLVLDNITVNGDQVGTVFAIGQGTSVDNITLRNKATINWVNNATETSGGVGLICGIFYSDNSVTDCTIEAGCTVTVNKATMDTDLDDAGFTENLWVGFVITNGTLTGNTNNGEILHAISNGFSRVYKTGVRAWGQYEISSKEGFLFFNTFAIGGAEGNATQKPLVTVNVTDSFTEIDMTGETWVSKTMHHADFNGNGIVIKNLTPTADASGRNGLFGYVGGAVIENIVLENTTVTGGVQAAALAGHACDGAKIHNITVKGATSVTIDQTTDQWASAGIVTGNCADATVFSGIAVTGNVNLDMSGMPADTKITKWSANYIGGAKLGTNDISASAYTITPGVVITAKLADGFRNTRTVGTSNLYYIDNGNGLGAFRDSVNRGTSNYADATVYLTADVTFTSSDPAWEPIAPNADSTGTAGFYGTFDGQGHKITGLTVRAKTAYEASGFFGALSGTAKNFILDTVKVENSISVGTGDGNATSNGIAAVAGSLYMAGYIDNVTVQNVSVTGNRYTGIIAGYMNGGSVTNCKVLGTTNTVTVTPDTVTGSADNGDKAGGIVGYAAAGTVSGNTVQNLTLKAYRDMGGIVGYANTAASVTGNTAKNVDIIIDGVNYNGYTTQAEHDAGYAVGQLDGTASDNTHDADCSITYAPSNP